MDKTFKLESVRNAIIFGGGHGIGLAICKKLISDNPACNIFVTYHNLNKANDLLQLEKKSSNIFCKKVDPTQERELISFTSFIKEKTKNIDLAINCIGTLHCDQFTPEKSLKQLSFEQFSHSFLINATITPIIVRELIDFFRGESLSIFASLSAKVGSISDNKLGGWYSYRASKAALNMFIKNISLEFYHRNINAAIFSIHPGTTATKLSKPFIKNTKLKVHSPEETAINILKVLNGKTIDDTGHFLNWNGANILW